MGLLAIKGHAARGKEVIELLEALGGRNTCNTGFGIGLYYSIEAGEIKSWKRECGNSEYVYLTLEEFLEKYPYKVGNQVLIPEYESPLRITDMKWTGNNVIYEVFTDEGEWFTAKELNETNPSDEEEIMEETKELLIGFTKDENGNMVLNTHKDYEIKEIDGKFMLLKKKPQYPKTYTGCCEVLKIEYPYFKTEEDGISASTYKNKIIGCLKQLLICRDAYWKIAGKHMGLDKPWEPDWNSGDQERYGIIKLDDNGYQYGESTSFVFPTEEMRDAFYENFKDLIEQCKELL